MWPENPPFWQFGVLSDSRVELLLGGLEQAPRLAHHVRHAGDPDRAREFEICGSPAHDATRNGRPDSFGNEIGVSNRRLREPRGNSGSVELGRNIIFPQNVPNDLGNVLKGGVLGDRPKAKEDLIDHIEFNDE